MTNEKLCAQCGATIALESCADRFAVLLAHDHSRQQPWGSRHAIAFAVYTLQHSDGVSESILQSCWLVLSRVYESGDDRQDVVNGLRATHRPKHGKGYDKSDAARARAWQGSLFPMRNPPPKFYDITIADVGDFEADTYPALLDARCHATILAWKNEK